MDDFEDEEKTAGNELSNLLREIVASSSTSHLKLLPISQVFFRLDVKEGNRDRGILRFDLCCFEDATLPEFLRLKILDDERVVLSREVSVRPLRNSKKYPGRKNMYQTELILLNQEQLLGISYGSKTMVIFSEGDHSQEFPLFIPWHEIKNKNHKKKL